MDRVSQYDFPCVPAGASNAAIRAPRTSISARAPVGIRVAPDPRAVTNLLTVDTVQSEVVFIIVVEIVSSTIAWPNVVTVLREELYLNVFLSHAFDPKRLVLGDGDP